MALILHEHCALHMKVAKADMRRNTVGVVTLRRQAIADECCTQFPWDVCPQSFSTSVYQSRWSRKNPLVLNQPIVSHSCLHSHNFPQGFSRSKRKDGTIAAAAAAKHNEIETLSSSSVNT